MKNMICISIFPWFCSYWALAQYFKKILSIQERGKIVRINKNEGLSAIKECLDTINRKKMKLYWKVVIKSSPRNHFEECTFVIVNLLKSSLFKS